MVAVAHSAPYPSRGETTANRQRRRRPCASSVAPEPGPYLLGSFRLRSTPRAASTAQAPRLPRTDDDEASVRSGPLTRGRSWSVGVSRCRPAAGGGRRHGVRRADPIGVAGAPTQTRWLTVCLRWGLHRAAPRLVLGTPMAWLLDRRRRGVGEAPPRRPRSSPATWSSLGRCAPSPARGG
jgi:hypothetical protein